MKRKGYIFFALAGLMPYLVNAQLNSSDSTSGNSHLYFFNVQVGTSISCASCNETSFSAATIHGVNLGRRWKVGAGIGFDAYSNWRIVPLFGSVSYDLFGKKNKAFTQLNYGWTKAWAPLPELQYGLKDTKGGQSLSAMIGYKIRYGDINVALLVGYKIQSVTSRYEYIYFWNPNDSSNTRIVEENIKRVAISLVVGWK